MDTNPFDEVQELHEGKFVILEYRRRIDGLCITELVQRTGYLNETPVFGQDKAGLCLCIGVTIGPVKDSNQHTIVLKFQYDPEGFYIGDIEPYDRCEFRDMHRLIGGESDEG